TRESAGLDLEGRAWVEREIKYLSPPAKGALRRLFRKRERKLLKRRRAPRGPGTPPPEGYYDGRRAGWIGPGFRERSNPPRSSSVISTYAQAAGRVERGRPHRTKTLQFPPIFSLIEAPEETLHLLAEFANVLDTKTARRIVLDQRDCKHVDLCAEMVATMLAR